MSLKFIKCSRSFVIHQHDHLFNKTCSGQTMFFNAKQANAKIIPNNYILIMNLRAGPHAIVNLKETEPT